MAERIILTGFMGMGKSSAGKKAAEILDVRYYDTDSWMETERGIDIPAFVKSDVALFRQIEAETLWVVLDQEPGIISTGGGIVSTNVGRNALRGSGVPVVWLQAPFEVAVSRVKADSGRERPLFADVEAARGLFSERQAWYQESATHVVDASDQVERVAAAIAAVAKEA